MSKKQKQKQSERKQETQPRQNTLRGNKTKLSEWPDRILRTVKRWINQLIGKRIQPTTSVDGTGLMTMPPPAGGDTAFRFTGALTLAIVVLVMVFGGILGTRLYSIMGMGSNRIKNVPVVYLQRGDTLKFKAPLIDSPVTIVEGLSFDGADGYSLEKNTVVSVDGKQLLYLNSLSQGSGELFLRNTDRAKPRNRDGDSRGRPVATGVLQSSFRFSEDGKTIMYMRAEGEGVKTLLRWRDGKEQVLDSRISLVLGMSKDNNLYYTSRMKRAATTDAMAGGYNLCRIGDDGMVQVLAEELSGQIVQFNPETGSVLFSLPAPPDEFGNTRLTLACWDGSQSGVVAEEISNVVDFSGSNLVFSTGITSLKSNPMQYFEDDMAAWDAAVTEPNEENFMVETTNLWGKKKTELDKKTYESAVAEYQAKVNRDEIRSAIAAQERSVRRSTLYHSAGSSRTLVDSDIMQLVDADAEAGVVVYTKERIPTPQKFKISQVADPMDAIRLINTVLINTVHDYYYAGMGKEPEIFLSLTKSERVKLELDGARGVYYIKEDVNGSGAPLNYISVQEDGLGVAKKVDDRVVGLTGMRYRDRMLYMREDSQEGSVSICGAVGQSRERLVDGLPIYPLPVVYDDILLAYRDYSDGRQTGSLTLYNNGKIKPVSRGVYSYSYRLPSFIYVMKDYDTGLQQGDLYLYSGNSEKLTYVDREVSAVKAG